MKNLVPFPLLQKPLKVITQRSINDKPCTVSSLSAETITKLLHKEVLTIHNQSFLSCLLQVRRNPHTILPITQFDT